MNAQTFTSSKPPVNTPWGFPDEAREVGPGVWSVQTPSHGGFHLSAERQDAMPACLRSSDGFYEEDCEWAKVVMAFPDLFEAGELQDAERTVRNWDPDAYTAHTGRVLDATTSRELERRAFEVTNHANFTVRSAFGDWAKFVPQGQVGMMARRDSDGAEAWFMVPEADYTAAAYPFVIDEGEHRRIEAPDPEGMKSKR